MILTKCAACAAPLAHNAPRCVRCHTRYCNQTCQHDHWRRGHKQICKKIHRGGNAEQYHANKKYKEAVAEAVEACADDTKGQTCYICTQALHWKTKEGLVRMCACRGTAGFAHVSCLAEQAKILVAEAEENNWDLDRFMPRWERWFTCSLCEQYYHGIVACALGWACWKTYVGRPETDGCRANAMTVLSNGLGKLGRYDEELTVLEARYAYLKRNGGRIGHIDVTMTNLAVCYNLLGRREEALNMRREVYARSAALRRPEIDVFTMALNLAFSLVHTGRYDEAKSFSRENLPAAHRALGNDHTVVFKLCGVYAETSLHDKSSTRDDIDEAVLIVEDVIQRSQRVMGAAHPSTQEMRRLLGALKTERSSRA